MRKIVTTEMSPDSVTVRISTSSSVDSSSSDECSLVFPMRFVNPRIALQVATLLVSDPTIPECNEKEEDK